MARDLIEKNLAVKYGITAEQIKNVKEDSVPVDKPVTETPEDTNR